MPTPRIRRHSLRFPGFLGLALAAGIPLLAHPGGHGGTTAGSASQRKVPRWTRAEGGTFEGFFLFAKEGRVAFERPGGGVLLLPVADLAPADQARVAALEARVGRLNQVVVTARPEARRSIQTPDSRRPWVPLLAVGGLSAAVALTGGVLQHRGWRRAGLATLGVGSVLVVLVACGGAGSSTTATTSTPGGGSIPANDPAVMTAAFAPFSGHLTTHADSKWFYVESDGMPDHNLMVGITSWQQQVPTPQPYTGSNAWQIPLQPVIAASPISAKSALFTGAIALAVNGVPIFNALNNRGDDAYLFGELDQWGGHAGRADDYHYHIAPLHLQATVGTGKAIAYALDGFPLYGETEPDGSPLAALDPLNGHFDPKGGYHYHGTRTYPYLNGGMRGVVQVSGDQIVPQPHTTPFRPWLTPLAGAVITEFTRPAPDSYRLTFTQGGGTGTVSYLLSGSTAAFTFVDPDGTIRTATYPR